MNWEDLSIEEQEFWNKLAKKHQKALRIVQAVKDHGCPQCKYKPKKWVDFEFHAYSTHGIPREILLEAMDIK